MFGLDTSKVLMVTLKLFIQGGSAKATPPLGPLLGQFGVNTVQFCKEFNELTEGFLLFKEEDDAFNFELIVYIHIYDDRKYSFYVDKPSTSFLLRTLANVSLGNPKSCVGVISLEDVIKLALFKFPDSDLYSSCKMIKGTARSIGIFIE